jgi:DNA-binding NarL/FixJ family response regulator
MSEMRVLLADDHSLFRNGIASLLKSRKDIRVVGEASDGAEAIEQARKLKPDIILMDISMPKCDGLQAVQTIKQEAPQIRIVILTVSDDDRNLFTAIKNGADGYLLKTIEPDELYEMLARVHRGEAPISGIMANRILQEFRQLKQGRGRASQTEEELSARETGILELVVRGETNSEIAKELGITENTVKIHLRNVLEKLHMHNRIQAALYAVHQGLVRDPFESK